MNINSKSNYNRNIYLVSRMFSLLNVISILLIAVSIYYLLFVSIPDLAFVAGAVLIYAVIRGLENKVLAFINSQDNSFTPIDNTLYYEETKPLLFPGSRDSGKGVLFIHGFSASSTEFNILLPDLEKQNIPYYSLSLSGFGSSAPEKLKTVVYEDWIYDAIKGYEIVSKLSDNVIVVAHSMGCLLALYLASKYKLKNIILTSPYLTYKQSHKWYARVIASRAMLSLFVLFRPYVFKKSRSQELSDTKSKRFVYRAVPTQAISQLWKLSEIIEDIKLDAKKISVLVGANDTTIETESVKTKLEKLKVLPDIHTFKNSGHNLFEGEEKVEVKKILLEILSQI